MRQDIISALDELQELRARHVQFEIPLEQSWRSGNPTDPGLYIINAITSQAKGVVYQATWDGEQWLMSHKDRFVAWMPFPAPYMP